MMHIEAIEPRRLMAATGLDPTFGTNGTVTLPNATLSGALASFSGGLFVEAAGPTGPDHIYKLTTRGRVDRNWGDNGRVASPNFAVLAIAYDENAGLLYAAGVTKRFAYSHTGKLRGNVAVLRVQRFDGDTGKTDTTFGDNGMATFKFGTTGSLVSHDIKIGRLLPLPGRQLAVAFDHESEDPAFNRDEFTRYATDVTVLKYRRNGTSDPAFGRRGICTVASGYRTVDTAITTGTQYVSDEPRFADIQPLADGSLRVITSRHSGTIDDIVQENTYEDSRTYVRSQLFRASGAADPSQDRSWRVAVVTSFRNGDTTAYVPLVVRADGTGGVTAVGRKSMADDEKGTETTVVTLSRCTPTRRVDTTLRLPVDGDLLPAADGYYAYQKSPLVKKRSQLSAIKLDSDFRADPDYNDGSETVTTLPSGDRLFTDADGRLLFLAGNLLVRISG